MSALVTQQKQNKGLAQKLEALDLKNVLQTAFVNPAICQCHLDPAQNTAEASILHFNSHNPNSKISLSKIKSSCAGTSPLLVKSGEELPGTQTGLSIESIQLTDIVFTGNSNEYEGWIKVSFDTDTIATALAPFKFKQRFRTRASSPSSAKTIEACLGPYGSSSSAPIKISSRQVSCAATLVSSADNTYGCVAQCNSGEVVAGGGMGWGAIYSSSGRSSYPDIAKNGWFCEINITGCSSGSGSCGSSCYATCLKTEVQN